MNELLGTVDWSRAQFALTAMYHWLFVPLTIGLSVIVAIMETIYVRTGDSRWKGITKFWMTLFGINFACGVATGIILEFEFGTNWSNYSWFVGDIFGAPLAIEVSRRFHLASTWLTALGVSLSALWILVANAWMQNPVGMRFDPAQMRNVMDNFFEVAFNAVAINKFFHAVFSGWTLAGVFVVGVSGWMLMRRRNIEAMRRSMKIGSIVGLAGILMTFYTGHGSAVQVARVQPMKLAAMEGLFNGGRNQALVGFGILDPEFRPGDKGDPMLFSIEIPYALSWLASGDPHAFVPGINDLIAGRAIDGNGDTVRTASYADRMASGRAAQDALRAYDNAHRSSDIPAMEAASADIARNFGDFGYGYFTDPVQAVPPVGLTFYSFHIMVIAGGFLLAILLIMLIVSYRRPALLGKNWLAWLAMLSVPAVWICSQSGWVTAEVGRQPWVIQDLLPTCAAISDVTAASVRLTFWIFAAIFTLLLVAEISIMLRYIAKASKTDIENDNH